MGAGVPGAVRAGAVAVARLAYGFSYALYIHTFYVTSWRALTHLVRGRNGWAKTRRNTERVAGAMAPAR